MYVHMMLDMSLGRYVYDVGDEFVYACAHMNDDMALGMYVHVNLYMKLCMYVFMNLYTNWCMC